MDDSTLRIRFGIPETEAALAYGSKGVPGALPPNATLVFEITLLAIQTP
jgi:FKBP-type peptidyl-prolyl cis-trans isomerase